MYFKVLAFFFSVIFFSSHSFAEKIGTEELKRIQKNLKAIDYLKVNFEQTVYTSLRKKSRKLSGYAYFAKPGKFRWVQEKSTPKEIIFGGKELVIYLPTEKSASQFGSLGSNVKEYQKLTNLVLNLDDLLEQYDLISAEQYKSEQLVTLQLKPKDKKLDIDSVKLSLSLDKNYIKDVLLNYVGGNWMQFSFSSPKTETLPADKFVFTKPADVKMEVFN